ncbi:MAG: DNA internalization-related competence protein ComEC/Rec2 [bacterium]
MSRQRYDSHESAPPLPRPMVKLVLALMSGIVYARYFPVSLSFSVILMLILILIWVTTFRKGLLGPRQAVHWGMALALTGLLGAVRMEALLLSWRALSLEVEAQGQAGVQGISGTVDEVHVYETGQAAVILANVRLEQARQVRIFPGKVEITGSAGTLASLRPGDPLRATGILYPIRGSRLPGGFNRQQYQYSLEIFASMPIRADTPLVRSAPAGWSPARGFAYAAMDAIQERLNARIPPAGEEVAALLGSICFGLRSGMPARLREALSVSGLAHVTSISGLHVSLVIFGLGYGLKRIGCKRRLSAVVTAGLSIFYVLMVGASIPTLRAVLMAFVFLGGYFTERRIDPMNTLALAAFLLLLLYPVELFLPSFQLSFTAVWILILMKPWDRFLAQRIRFQSLAWLIRASLASAAVSIGMAPLTITYFQVWGWGAIPGNLAAIPITNFLMPITYAWALSLTMPVPLFSRIMENGAVILAEGLLRTIYSCSNPDLFKWEIAFPCLMIPAALFFAFILMTRPGLSLFQLQNLSIRAGHAALALLGVAVWMLPLTRIPHPLRIDFLGLGQGDCSVIQTPGGRVILIDGGPPEQNREDAAAPALAEYLASQGISRIDLVILSHPEEDHIGELQAVAHRYPIALVLEGCRNQPTRAYQEFIELLEKKRIPRDVARQGTRIDVEPGITGWVLHPDEKSISMREEVNELSVVLLLQFQNLSFLFPGDVSQKIEERLCESYENWDVDVLKVPHHGSRYSTSARLLSEIRPEFAIIHAGRNRYGHPHPETLERLRNTGATVLRTDYDGTVSLLSWGSGFQIHTTGSNRVFRYRP